MELCSTHRVSRTVIVAQFCQLRNLYAANKEARQWYDAPPGKGAAEYEHEIHSRLPCAV